MSTIILVIFSTTYLALFGVLDSTGAVGIFSGIAGYVLGGLEKKSNETEVVAENTKAGSST